MILPDQPKPSEPVMVPAPMAPQPYDAKLNDQLTKAGILMLTDKFDQDHIMPLVKRIMQWNMLPESEAREA